MLCEKGDFLDKICGEIDPGVITRFDQVLRIAARTALGFMYFAGQGVRRDYVQAYMWFTLADPRHTTHDSNRRPRCSGRQDVARSDRRGAADGARVGSEEVSLEARHGPEATNKLVMTMADRMRGSYE